jgi:hypothetical protein
MGYIFVDRGDDSIRHEMRRNMRDNYRHDGYSPMMRGDSEHWYKKGYEEGWRDHEDEMEMRRRRNNLGQYV